ncbi:MULTISPECIES: bifunctional lysylphosphatidylglycerol flippase/synthetase MprF [Falsihalocynthiibacter]|uniref:bifunctional lysylphosphatidylglycerol flippase/synthetase MprF n=1 Tax=Falsihalocynthiibacter TaxID=2854182 RepID=UPI003001BDB8
MSFEPPPKMARKNLATLFMRHQIARQAAPIVLAIGFVALFLDNMVALDVSQIWAAVQTVSGVQWGMATVATAASFWAVGRYDAVIHRHFRTQVGNKIASRAGIAAIAVSQTTGFGLFTGALTRWRLLPEISFLQATQISAAVAVSFLAGLAVVMSFAALLFPLPVGIADLSFGYLVPLLLLPPLGLIALVTASLLQPHISFRGHRLNWPSVSAIFAITGLAAADTLAASGALFALLPPALELGFSQLYPAFLIAFGVALVSGTPGGVGPFEVTLLMLLPFVPAEPLLGAILAYRTLYYALPALLGAITLARGPFLQRNKPNKRMLPQTGGIAWFPSRLEALIHSAPRAEANLLRQGDKALLHAPNSAGCFLTASRGQALIALGDPLVAAHPQSLLASFKNMAEADNHLPFLYKISGRMALEARKFGMAVTPVSREAWLTPSEFCLQTPEYSQLRRKLRKAQKAGISLKPLFNHADLHLTLGEMTRVAREWSATHGGERGFTMGIYDPAYVQTQRCFLAYKNDSLVGFVSFSTVAAEWTLDLMRHASSIPDGTMHALVAEAIKTAAIENIPRLSLASVPWQPAPSASRLAHWFWGKLGTLSGGAGLTQFKSSFAPHWETLYMAGPNRLGLALGAFDVTRAILAQQPAANLATSLTTTLSNGEKRQLETLSQTL